MTHSNVRRDVFIGVYARSTRSRGVGLCHSTRHMHTHSHLCTLSPTHIRTHTHTHTHKHTQTHTHPNTHIHTRTSRQARQQRALKSSYARVIRLRFIQSIRSINPFIHSINLINQSIHSFNQSIQSSYAHVIRLTFQFLKSQLTAKSAMPRWQ